MKDYINAIDLLKQIDLKKFIIILRPHPYLKDIRKKVTTEYKNNLNTKIIIRDDLSSKQIIELSDFILCGDSTTWVESLIYKKKILRFSEFLHLLNHHYFQNQRKFQY